MAKHALLSASASDRWLNCTPSARLTENLPDTTSEYAAEGTLAHSLGELELSYQLKEITKSTYTRKLRDIKKNELYSEDMPDYIEIYTTYVFEKLAEAQSHTPDALIFLEQKLDFSKWVPEGFGTCDCIIIADDLMEIIDLKYGKGIEVLAEDNTQMMLYALGALEAFGWIYDIKSVRMTIMQPRLDNISTREVYTDDLLAWADTELKEKAQEAWEGTGDCISGDWCKWCKVKSTCKARADAMLAVAKPFEGKDKKHMDTDDIALILYKADELQAWAKDIQDYALEQARDHGVKYSGWKLVEGRSNRKYSDEDLVASKLTDEGLTDEEIYNKKVKGITDMEKKLGKKRFSTILQDLIIKPAGKPALVVSEDKRPEINSVETDFDL